MNLKNVCELYSILGKYLPDPLPGEVLSLYTSRVFEKLLKYPEDLLKSLVLMTGLTGEQLAQMSAEELWQWWMDGISESKILQLKNYLEEVADVG